jgi:hypothetical protein
MRGRRTICLMASQVLNSSEVLRATRTLKASPWRSCIQLWLDVLGHSLGRGRSLRAAVRCLSPVTAVTTSTRLHLQRVLGPADAISSLYLILVDRLAYSHSTKRLKQAMLESHDKVDECGKLGVVA